MMQQIAGLTGTALLMIGLLNSPAAEAFFGNMMNPSRWFGGGRDHYDDYYDGPVGPGYGPGYYAAPMGYGAPGYAAPGYAAPAYGYVPPASSAPASTDSAESSEIMQLKKRIEQLEQEQAARQAVDYSSLPGSYPATTAAPQPAYSVPAGAQSTPTGRQPESVQESGQPGLPQSPPGVEWRPSGYYHPAMQ